jgi:hypothetical protein
VSTTDETSDAQVVFNQNLNRAFGLFELLPVNEISVFDGCRQILSKCCTDMLRPPRLSECGFYLAAYRGSVQIPIMPWCE